MQSQEDGLGKCREDELGHPWHTYPSSPGTHSCNYMVPTERERQLQMLIQIPRAWQSKTHILVIHEQNCFPIFLHARFHFNWADWCVTWKVFNCSFALGPNMDITEGSRASFMDKLMQGSQKCNFESWQMELIYLSQRTGRPLPHVALWFKVSIYHRYDPTPSTTIQKVQEGLYNAPKFTACAG